MADDHAIERVWTIIESVGVCMLTTHGAGGLRRDRSKHVPTVPKD